MDVAQQDFAKSHMMENGMCKCTHHKVVPVLIVLFGLTFLLGNLGILSGAIASIVWPSLIILGGLMKFSRGMCSCCKD
mgnify:CR=1 FL=1